MRRQKLGAYFELMDSNNDGYISAEDINLENLPTVAIELLGPVILEIESLGV
jgi:hypothetical protein